MDSEILLNIGFIDIGRWVMQDERSLAYDVDPAMSALAVKLEDPVALYAFVEGQHVRYIGKTARSIRRRFVGYCRPGQSQSTNLRCHSRIRDVLSARGEVRIFIFNPITHLNYGQFEIDLAAGLEESLIKAFQPPWNGRERGRPLSEDAEREMDDSSSQGAETPASKTIQSPIDQFQMKLGQTYYTRGVINTGVDASRNLGKHGEPVRILFEDDYPTVVSSINRTANRSGGVRVIGRNQDIANWFQNRFELGDFVIGEVLDANTIRLRSARGGSV